MKRFKIFTLAGLLFAFAIAHATGNLFDFMGMMRGMQFGPLTLLRTPDVRKEMGLSKAQDGDLKKLTKEYDDALKAMTQKAQGSGDTAKMTEMAKEMEALETSFGKRALGLLDEPQRKRLSEIRVQAMGFRALLDPEIGAALAVTEDQKASLSVMDREYQQAMGKILRSNARSMQRDRTALMKEYKAKALQILSAEQGARFTAMEGAPFKGTAGTGI